MQQNKPESKKTSESSLESTYMVMPEHTNPRGYTFGGTIMAWVDITAGVVAFRHCRTSVVTASMDELSFLYPVNLGDLVTLKASVNFTSRHSMEVGVKVLAENPITGESSHTATAYLTFVSLDKNGKTLPIAQVIPETDEHIRRFEAGKARYQERLNKRKKRG
ncbi:MAG: acyl-CoA thioesterase [Deltaproteobacteria bacterium]|nr:acyl-CoA thioesterase [Deltaproteobacteria bacterium]